MTTNKFQRLIIGLLSILIVFFATYANHAVSFPEGEDVVAVEGLPASDHEAQKDAPKKEYKLRAYEAVLPLVQATFSSSPCFFLEIQPVIEDFTEDERVLDLPFNSYFNTLFRLIISPNAP